MSGLPLRRIFFASAEQPIEALLAAGGRAEHVALVEQRRVGDHPSFIQLGDEIFARDVDVVEENLVEALVAGHLHQRAHGDAGSFHIDQNVGNPAMLGRLGIGAHQAEHPVGILRARGPDLLAVDDELVAMDFGAGA